MNRNLILCAAVATLLIAPTAIAQIGFPSCAGQPVLTGDQTGTVNVGAYASFTSYGDTIDCSGGDGCNEVAGLPDSVVCFEPANPCTVTARFITPSGTDSTLNVLTGCSTTPTACLASERGDTGEIGAEVLLSEGLHCYVGSADGAPVGARFEFDNISTCGTLAGGGGGGGGGGGELDEIYFIPAAARAAGSGSSFFVTDVDVNNSGRWTATYKFLWLPRDTNNAEPAESGEFTIGPGVSIRYKDVLAQVFNVGGGATAVGALAILSDSSDLLFMSRTFNSSDEGTFGQAIVGIEEDDLIRAGERRRVLFMTENDEFRSNLGFQNGTDSPIRVKWSRYRADGTSIDTGETFLPPWGNTQWNRVFNDSKPIEAAYVDVWTETSGGRFAVYGSVLDSATSDPTTVPGQ
jgi:hypothetical protein